MAAHRLRSADYLTRFERHQDRGRTLYVLRGFALPFDARSLFEPEGLTARSGVAVAAGRGAIHALTVGRECRLLVRHYRRGGVLAPLLGDRYLGGGTPRPVAELLATEFARAHDVAVPTIAGALVRPAGPFAYRGDLFVVEEPGSVDLLGFLRREPDPARRRAVLRRTGAEIRRMHDAGLDHRDLNVKNVLVRRDGAIMILDFDRARVFDRLSDPARARALTRLLRSAIKRDLVPARVGRGEVIAFVRGYARGDAAAIAGLRAELKRMRRGLPFRRLLWKKAST
ncbi:MAG: phosphotransferase [Myxococcales bacterium]|nr:phosphotransferase [Myxococcales bacterium]